MKKTQLLKSAVQEALKNINTKENNKEQASYLVHNLERYCNVYAHVSDFKKYYSDCWHCNKVDTQARYTQEIFNAYTAYTFTLSGPFS